MFLYISTWATAAKAGVVPNAKYKESLEAAASAYYAKLKRFGSAKIVAASI